MALLRWHAESNVPVERALELGRGALGVVGRATRSAVVAADLAGDARVLGAYQRREDALVTKAPVLRRATGGPAVVAGEGVMYLALALSDASALMACPRDRVLNRNVRPFLAALRRFHGAAHYFGREWISLDKRPAGLVAWTRQPSGAVLLEAFLGVGRTFAVPDGELAHPPGAPRMLGKAPITLREALSPLPSARELALALAEACASMTPHELEERAIEEQSGVTVGRHLPLLAERLERATHHPGMRWSRAREVPIGLVRAGLAIDARGVVEAAALTGDFFQDADAPERLEAALVGGLPTPERLRDALNATYGRHGVVIEGLRSLQPVLDAFVEVSGAASFEVSSEDA